MRLIRLLIMAWLLLGSSAASLWAGVVFSEIVAFGDSLTDTGNVFIATSGTIPPSPPYFNGRFSNGPVWVERLASQLGLPVPTPSLAGGTNSAFGDAGTSLTGFSARGAPNIGTQIASYLLSNTLRADQLIVLWGGANDFFSGQIDPAVPVANIATEIAALAAAGGENFLVPNLPPLGELPAFLGTPSQSVLDALSSQFDSQLATALDNLQTNLGVTVFRLDTFGFFEAALNNPALFGFTNVTDPALDLNTGTVVPNPEQYLFWDPVHPTAAAHRILGDLAAATVVVPEPSSLVLLGLGSCGAMAYGRLRRKRAV